MKTILLEEAKKTLRPEPPSFFRSQMGHLTHTAHGRTLRKLKPTAEREHSALNNMNIVPYVIVLAVLLILVSAIPPSGDSELNNMKIVPYIIVLAVLIILVSAIVTDGGNEIRFNFSAPKIDNSVTVFKQTLTRMDEKDLDELQRKLFIGRPADYLALNAVTDEIENRQKVTK